MGIAWQASFLKSIVIRPHSKHNRQKGLWSRWRIPQSIGNKHQVQQKELQVKFTPKKHFEMFTLTDASSSVYVSVENLDSGLEAQFIDWDNR